MKGHGDFQGEMCRCHRYILKTSERLRKMAKSIFTEHSSARPLKSGLGRDEHARAEMTLGEGLADDFFRTAESIGRSGIDEIDAVLDRRSDRGNGFRLLGSTPHPTADGPGAQGDTRHFKRCADDGRTLRLDFAGFGFTSHGLAPSSPQAARERALSRAGSMLRTFASQVCRSDVLRPRCSCT